MQNILICFDDGISSWFSIILCKESEVADILKFHGMYVNSIDNDPEIERSLIDFFYTSEGDFKFVKIEESLECRDFRAIIQCGFLP